MCAAILVDLYRNFSIQPCYLLSDKHEIVLYSLNSLIYNAKFRPNSISRVCGGVGTMWDGYGFDFKNIHNGQVTAKSKVKFEMLPINEEDIVTEKPVVLNMEELYYYLQVMHILSQVLHHDSFDSNQEAISEFRKKCEVKGLYDERLKKYCEENGLVFKP